MRLELMLRLNIIDAIPNDAATLRRTASSSLYIGILALLKLWMIDINRQIKSIVLQVNFQHNFFQII